MEPHRTRRWACVQSGQRVRSSGPDEAGSGYRGLNYTDPFGLNPCLAGPVAMRVCAAIAVSAGSAIGAAGTQIYDNIRSGADLFDGVGDAALTGARDGAVAVLGGAAFGRALSGVSAQGAASAPARGSPRPSPNFSPPTNPPQYPPTVLPEGHSVRMMGPTRQYPNGYWRQMNADGHYVNPATGRQPGSVSRAEFRAQTHVELPPP